MRSTRLVGRDEELDQLSRAAELAREGQPTFRLVEGEAGIGKTRLVMDAVSAFMQPGEVVAVGQCVAVGGSTLPYGVAADLVRDLVRQVGAGQVLAEDSAALSALLAGQTDGSVGPRTLTSIAAGFLAVVERLAHEQLLCLVFEDLHWSDASSRELIDHLLRGIRACRLLVLCTRRTHDAPAALALQEFVAELVRHPRADRLTLPRLDQRQVAEQVAGILGDRQAPQLDRIVALGQGNPFLTEELVSAPAGTTPVGDVMLSRVDGLSPAGRQLVHAAAVGDGHLWHTLLTRASGLAEPVVDAAATEVTAAFVLEPDEHEDRYTFRHALLREAVARSLLPAERKRWHRRWAEALETDPGPIPVATAQIAIAHHWVQTDDLLRAFDAAVLAVEAAESIQASPEAAVLCQRLLELWPRVSDASTRTVFARLDYAWTALGHLGGSGEWPSALALAERELAHPEARQNAVWRIRLEQVRCTAAERTASRVRGATDTEADIEALLAAPPDNLLTQTLLHYGVRLRDRGRLSEAQQLFERAAEVAAVMTTPEVLATRPPSGVVTAKREGWRVEAVLAGQEWATGSEERALQRLCRLQSEARSAGLDGLDPRTDYAWLLELTGRHREAAAVAREAIEVIENPRFNRTLWIGALAPLLDALLALGEWDEVQEWLDRAAGLQSTGAAHDEVVFFTARLSLGRGDLDRARTAAHSLGSSTPDEAAGVGGPDPWRHWLRAETAAAAGEDAVARTELDAVWASLRWREMHVDVCWQPLLLAARLEADRPSSDTAERVAAIRARAAEMHKAGDLGVAWSTHLDAELLRGGGSRDPAPWEATAAAWARIGDIHAEGWALVRLAACQVAVGSRGAAGDALARAHATGSRLGARPLLDAVTGLARRARIDVGMDPAQGGSLPLTSREIEVLRLIALGHSNNQIAHELFISPKTASAHLSHIFTKLGVHTRTEAATVAIRHHLLDDTA